MDMIIAILLWMGVVHTGSTYSQAEFNELVNVNQPVIDAVLADPVQQEMVWATVGTREPDVIIGEGE